MKSEESRATIVGAGIASMAAAVFLVRDGKFKGQNVRILEALDVAGGALDASGSPEAGYIYRGGRMFDYEAYECLYDLMDTVPALSGVAASLKQEMLDFNLEYRSNSKARLVNSRHEILNAGALGLNTRDRMQLLRLTMMSERAIGPRRIADFFGPHFWTTNFWALWRTTFAFQTWSSASEMRRYCLRFLHEFSRLYNLAGVRRTPLNQYDALVRPIRKWLEEQGVRITFNTTVTGVDFSMSGGSRRAERIHYQRRGGQGTVELGENDYAFITIGSMTADSTLGSNRTVPALNRDKTDGTWALWENIASQAPDFGRPQAFAGNVDESKWESFTLTFRDPAFIRRMIGFSGNQPGTGGLVTLKDSSWLMSVVVPRQPHFEGQPDELSVAWGYSLFGDRQGDFVKKKMSECTGDEILSELLQQLGFMDIYDTVMKTTTVRTAMMPYITSHFQPRREGDRPLVVPKGARNFAFLGQFVEMPEDVVFTVGYSVRSAMTAVYTLLNVGRKIPSLYRGLHDPRILVKAIRSAYTRGKPRGQA
jgi:oleate hydratase